MSPLSRLSQILASLPGIGPRHAERLAYHISSKNETSINELKQALEEVKDQRKRCPSCRAIFFEKDQKNQICSFCRDPKKSNEQLIVTDTEINRNNIEKSNVANARYFILGRTSPVTDTNGNKIPIKELEARIKDLSKQGLKEVILAFNYTPEGEHTASMVKNGIEKTIQENDLKISLLGRGFSAGTEVEYSDTDTLKHAFKNRS
ncbi:MAG: toprim domain-containing protein [Candidatus Paceibacterota bacterium]